MYTGMPESPYSRKHGPEGLLRYQSYKDWLRDEFTFRCVYCLERERWYPNGHAGFGVDHVMPKGQPRYAHLLCYYPNLVYACNRCNSAKSDRLLLDPCEDGFASHIRIHEDGEIEGLTVQGRRVVNYLGLDLRGPTSKRLEQITILRLYTRFPHDDEVRALYLNAFGFPEDIPDLSEHTRTRNSKPEGVEQSYYQLREAKALPDTYGV
jgi:hypothetical protein